MSWTGLDESKLVPVPSDIAAGDISLTGMRTGRVGFKKFIAGRKAKMRAQLRRVAPRGWILRNRLASAKQRRQNLRTAGFLGIEKKFYDTSLVDAALTAPTDCTGGEHDPSATSMISAPAGGVS